MHCKKKKKNHIKELSISGVKTTLSLLPGESILKHLKLSLTIFPWRDFAGDPVIKNPPSNAGDKGSIPGRETKNLHAMEKLSPMCCNRRAWEL